MMIQHTAATAVAIALLLSVSGNNSFAQTATGGAHDQHMAAKTKERTAADAEKHSGHAHQAGEKAKTGSDDAATTSTESGKASGAGLKVVDNKICPVSGESIGSMGDGIKVTYKSEQILLCCKGCVKKFNADPEKYIKAAKKSAKTPRQ